MERAGVYQENGHVAYFTFAVTDQDKNSSAVDTGGSKVLVVPFNGVQFDCDNGDQDSCDELAADAGPSDSGVDAAIDGGALDGALDGAVGGANDGESDGTGGGASDGGRDGAIDSAFGGGTGRDSGVGVDATAIAEASASNLDATVGSPSGDAAIVSARDDGGGPVDASADCGATTGPSGSSGCSCMVGGGSLPGPIGEPMVVLLGASFIRRRRTIYK
jgi:MYXO-CTERM domain-containing protein